MSLKIKNVYEGKDVFVYLEARKLTQQYKKAKTYLLNGLESQIRFKQRQPKSSGMWSFRINKQFRAIGCFDSEDNFIVFEIDNHQ